MSNLVERDLDEHPYTSDEARVAKFFCDHGIGGGPDPIGSILASHAYLAAERNELRAQLSSARKALEEIIEANKDFRDGMPQNWDGDPLQDACDAAEKLLKESAK